MLESALAFATAGDTSSSSISYLFSLHFLHGPMLPNIKSNNLSVIQIIKCKTNPAIIPEKNMIHDAVIRRKREREKENKLIP